MVICALCNESCYHPDISLGDLMNLIKGFVDILILASGRQSSGLPATWDADNIKKAFQWGIFFEEVFKRLHDTVYFEDSVKELDAALLLNLTSDPLFPQTGLSDLLKIVRRSNLVESENNPSEGLPCHFLKKEEMLSEICFWNNWWSRNLSYLLDKRTMKLLSGANLIFSAPKLQWIRVFEQLMFPTGANNDNLLDIMEILLLGFNSSRWNCSVEHFISHYCDFLPVSKQYSDLHLIYGYSQPSDSKSEPLTTKEKDIIEYLMQLLRSQPHRLWHVPPVLVAAAIPSGSILFRMYFNDIGKQFNEASSLTRCGCTRDGKEHKDYVFTAGFDEDTLPDGVAEQSF